MRSKLSGVTLIELLVGLAITAILATMAGPSFVRLLKSNSMAGSVNTFLADVRFARSEAIRRGSHVVMCRSEQPEDPAATCAADAGLEGKGWASGWLLFEDRDGSGNVSAGDEMLRVQAPLSGIGAIVEGTPGAATRLKFVGTGRLHDAGLATALRFGGANYDTDLQRVVCLAVSGRARVAGDGMATCGANNE